TLNYEVFFYLLFAAALALNVSPLAFLTPCLTAIALIGAVRGGSWPDFTSLASPIVIEFLLGAILAHFVMRRAIPGRGWSAVLLIGGFLLLLIVPEHSSLPGVLCWGLPAAAIVTGAVGLEDVLAGRLPQWLLAAGDASYALYLSHTFLVPYIIHGVACLKMTGASAYAASIFLSLAISLPIAALVHQYVETPIIKGFKRLESRPAREVKPPVALAPIGVSESL
ncbi:MAG TPA: hypothetical protein VHY22_16585, partial [Chthoniobacteraceae bacterium]|nr:hypothetical protein [Chthoniobacteraceae bacterium]